MNKAIGRPHAPDTEEAPRREVKPLASREKDVIVGCPSTPHDSSLAVICDDVVYAEGLERHTQNKRAWASIGIWYSTSAIRKTLTRLDVLPLDEADIVFRR